MEYIILRTTRAVSRDPEVLVSAQTESAEDLKVEVAELAPKEWADAWRDPAVIALAPPMPVQLIQPDSESESEPPSLVPSVSWGVRAVGAADSGLTGNGITVAVLDTGIDKNYRQHPAFKTVEKIELVNFTNEQAVEDLNLKGHGTHCAGTIFGRPVDGCRIGVAPGVQRALIGKILDQNGRGSTDAIVKGIQWAFDQGAHVVSMSLGFDYPGYREMLVYQGRDEKVATSMALEGYRSNMRLFDSLSPMYLHRNRPNGDGVGMVIVAAAGNESKRPKYRLVTAPPAAAEGFVSVAAVGESGDPQKPFVIAPFSNAGARVAAPGVAIPSAKIGEGLKLSNGTSMATPHVAGVAALWAEQLFRETRRFVATRVIARLEGKADSTAGLDADDVGLGLVQAPR